MSGVNKSSEVLRPKKTLIVLMPLVAVLVSLSIVLGLTTAARAMGRPVPVYPLLLIPVLVGAFWGGWSAGLFGMILGLGTGYLLQGEFAFDLQGLSPDVDRHTRLVFFIAESLVLCGIGHRYQVFRREASAAARHQEALAQEIDRRRKLEESVLRAQRTVRSQVSEIENIYATTPIGLCSLDRDLRVMRINQRLAGILGISVQEVVGKSVQEIVPVVSPTICPLLRRVIASGKPILEKEISGRMPNGSHAEHILLVSFLPIKEDSGFVLGVNAAVRDITRQVESGESAWQDSQTRLLLALEAGRMAVWERDLSTGGMIWLDPMNIHSATDFEEQFLTWVQDIAEQSLSSDTAEERPIQSCCRDFRIAMPDGQSNWIEARGMRVLDQRGSCRRLVGVLSDATDRKRAEESLSHIKEVEEALREADRRKDAFIALLAHELRNPLAPILTSAQLLKRRGSERPDLLASATDSIERQVKYLTRLINDLLDISRVARGKLQLRFEMTNMASVIAHAVEVCRPVIEKNQQELVLRGTDQALYLWGDPARLSQIIANVLMNATKFTPVNGRIELAMQRTEREISITVRDNGIGIEPDALEHIFEPFLQFDRPLHDGHSGLGVGLALVKSLVEMHGGRISVISPGKDQGSEFSIRLPLANQSFKGQSDLPTRANEVHPIHLHPPIPRDKAYLVRLSETLDVP